MMHEVLTDQPRSYTRVSKPMPRELPPAAVGRGTGAKSAERELHHMRELPWIGDR